MLRAVLPQQPPLSCRPGPLYARSLLARGRFRSRCVTVLAIREVEANPTKRFRWPYSPNPCEHNTAIPGCSRRWRIATPRIACLLHSRRPGGIGRSCLCFLFPAWIVFHLGGYLHTTRETLRSHVEPG